MPPLQLIRTPSEGSRSMLKNGDLGQLPMAVALVDEVECAVVEGAMTVDLEAREEETILKMVLVAASCRAEEGVV